MEINRLRDRLLTAGAVCAMVYLFFIQARIVMRPTGLDIKPMQMAYGYSDVAFSGKVYWDEGETPVGIGTGVAIYINGTATSTTSTTSGGNYSFTGLTISAHDVVSVYIDGESEDGMLVGKYDDTILSNGVTGMDIFKDRLILRTAAEDLQVTTTDLDTADGSASDVDVTAVYTLDGNDLHLGNNKELYIDNSVTHVTSGSLYTHDLEVRGTLTMGTGNITASGSLVVAGTGTLTTTGDTTLTSISSGEILRTSTSTLGNLYIDSGLRAYFRFDEGTGVNASGSTLNTGTGGTLTNGVTWIQTHSGTTTFYNPHSIDLDGTDDFVDFGDAFDISSSLKRTFTGWFKRKSATTEDVIFSKKSASGSSNIGYQFYIDDESDKLLFEVADGSTNYTITSTSTVTDTSWHHFGVTWNPLDTDDSNIFLDGSIDVASKAGSLTPSSDTYTSTKNFIIGADDNETGPFYGSIDDFRIYNRTMSGAEMSSLYAGNKATGSGTYRLTSNLDVNGDLGIYAATLDVGANYSVNVTGDMSIYGELLTNSGTVTLDGTSSQTIRGSTAFNQLAATSTVTKTLTFESNTEQTVSGALTLQGAVNKRMSLRVSRTGSRALLIAESSGSTVLEHLDVKDNNALSGATLVCTEGCVDSSNNTNWIFEGECQDGVVNTGEQCDDGNSNNDDECPNDCQYAVCGDSVVEGEEQCDPPNVGACLSNCLLRSAGGGGGGNVSSAGGNTSYYKKPEPPDGCGNGIVQEDLGEDCDEGTRFNGLGTCSYDCKRLYCGDGIISPQINEDCEPESAGTVDGVTTFTVATCGETCTAPVVTVNGQPAGGCQRVFYAPCESGSEQNQTVAKQCGNGIVEAGEECDKGGTCVGGSFNGSVWTDRTSAETCISGGGTTKAISGDGCSDTCKTEFCGDGIIQKNGLDNKEGTTDDEQCDSGSICSNDAEKTCRLDKDCGDGNTCDYHAVLDASCSSSCKQTDPVTPSLPSVPRNSSECGNGIIESGEQCDDGNTDDLDTCSANCRVQEEKIAAVDRKVECGNGIVEENEQCDNGENNSDLSGDACRLDCTNPRCGDFILDSNEECDNGDGNSDLMSDACRTNCTLPVCGDGIADSGEECDGGLNCTAQCVRIETARCGDGVVSGQEQCDDGNFVAGDGCSVFCQDEIGVRPAAPAEPSSVLGVSARSFILDADVVVVNPTEYANAISFAREINESGCATLVIKGKNHKAMAIREAALQQHIPIVKNISLAQALFAEINPGETIFNYCDDIADIKTSITLGKKVVATKPSAPVEPVVVPQNTVQIPTPFNQNYYQYAQVAQIVQGTPPAGDTGPGALAVVLSGVAGGVGWIRRKKKDTL